MQTPLGTFNTKFHSHPSSACQDDTVKTKSARSKVKGLPRQDQEVDWLIYHQSSMLVAQLNIFMAIFVALIQQ